MKITVFGATGQIGSHIVQQALEEGNHVTAFTRKPNAILQPHTNLEIRQGDVLNPDDVAHAITGQDAVICALGMPLFNKEKLRTKGTQEIVAAMQKSGVKRLICLSAFGVGDSAPLLPWYYTYLIFPLAFRRLVDDHTGQEKCITASSLDWTIVRPANFTKGSRTGIYQHGLTAKDATPAMKISHPDVAEFMLAQLNTKLYLHKAPVISY